MPNLTVFFTTGVFILDERSGGADPLLIPIQGGLQYKLSKQFDVKFAVTYYSFVDVEGTSLEFSEQFADVGNTLVDEALVFDYDSVSVGVEFGVNHLLGDIMPYIGLVGEYVHNPDPDDDHDGYLAGIKIGHRNVSKSGQWQARFLYRRLERDAWPDVFPDSDFLGGSTNGKGYEVIVNYAIIKNVTLGLDYYHSEQIDGDADQDLLQLDVALKF